MKLTVTYELTDEQAKRLEKLLELTEHIPGWSTMPVGMMFQAVMELGSDHDIDARLHFYENSIREIVEQMKVGGGMNKAYRGACERMADRAIADGIISIDINWINLSAKESGSGGADRITKKLIAAGYRPDGESCAPEVREAYEAGRKVDGRYIRMPQEIWRLTDETPAAGTAGES